MKKLVSIFVAFMIGFLLSEPVALKPVFALEISQANDLPASEIEEIQQDCAKIRRERRQRRALQNQPATR